MSAPAFALLVGLAFTGAGLLGFIPSLVLPPPAGAPETSVTLAHGYLLGLFPVNALHNGVHLLTGLTGFVAWAGALSAVTYARALAVIYAALAIMGLIPGLNTVFGLVPIYGHDVWLHAVTAAAAAYVGFRSALRKGSLQVSPRAERRRNDPNRRHAAKPVAYDRRRGAYDRRQATFDGTPLSAG